MGIRQAIIIWLFFSTAGPVYGLQPDEILVIANSDITTSVQIAQYYCAKRKVPTSNIIVLPLGSSLSDTISRDGYEKQLAEPIRKKLSGSEFAGKIRCLLTTWGVPFKVGKRGPLKGQEEKLKQLRKLKEQLQQKLKQLKQSGAGETSRDIRIIKRKLKRLQVQIDLIVGKVTGACVDSELSMVLFGDYELYRWQRNELKNKATFRDFKTLMVCRIDGPGFKIARGLVDKATAAEKRGLKGIAYVDSRGIGDDSKPYSPGYFDQSLRELALMLKSQTQMPVILEGTDSVFGPGRCPSTALYCGWYSLKKYVDAFDFVDGAIGYHISSLEAVDLRDPNSSQWCPAMLADGITATLGAVAEPYLHSFPLPSAFFAELLNGRCLVEAYYRTKPFNSWQLILIGDPLYRPFK